MADQPVFMVAPTDQPVFMVAPTDKNGILTALELIAEATAKYYAGLVSSGVPPEVAERLTMEFVKMLPALWKR